MALDLSALTTEQQIAAIYIGYYERAGEPDGANFWEAALENPGFSLADIASDFAVQDETLEAHPFFQNPTADAANAFIAELYGNLFAREADVEGLTFWGDILVGVINGETYDTDGDGNDDITQVGDIILAIIEGARNVEGGTQDLTTILNKLEVATAWTDAAEAAGATAAFAELSAEFQASSKSIVAAVTSSETTVTNAKGEIGEVFAPEPVEGNSIFLTSATDVNGQVNLVTGEAFEATADNDTFWGYIAQNPFAGGVSNTLSSADRLDGEGGDDRLYAELSFEFLGTDAFGAGLTDIQPRLTSIETIDIEARDFVAGEGFGGLGFDFDVDTETFSSNPFLPITVDGKNIVGHDVIGSYQSDGDLKIENLTTKETDAVSSARNTSDITIKMAYTDNMNTDGDASDLHVLFDNDYLLSGQVEQGFADFFLLDQDAELALLTGGIAEGRLDDLDKNGIQFRIDTNGDGVVDINDDLIEVAFDDTLIVNDDINTHQEFRDALQDPLQALIDSGVLPEGTTIELFEYTQVVQDDLGRNANQATLDGGTLSNLIPAVRVELGNDAEVVAVGFSTPDTEVPPFNFFGRVKNEFEQDDQPISINIDLEKAGRGGEGGNLIVGGKAANVSAGIAGGIEVFNVNVIGGSELPSWIGSLNSTLDALDQVYVTTDEDFAGSGDVADLTINEIGGAAFNNGGETDVRYFDSTGFEGDLRAFANLDEFGNGAHSYLLGGGDDLLSITFGDADTVTNPDNDVFGGAAGDSLTINTGGGDDTLRLNSADRDVESGRATGADLEFLDIETGAGEDTVFYDTDNANSGPLVTGNDPETNTTTGDGASISTSAGEDNIYMHGEEYFVGGVRTGDPITGDARFTELSILGIGDADNFQLFEGSLQVSFAGVLSEWVDIDYDRTTYTTSREDIRDAILAAVASNSALEGMIEIVELADGSLMARSLVSGQDVALTVDLEGPVASSALSDNTDGYAVADSVGGADEPALDPAGAPVADNDGWPLLNSQPTLNQISLAQLSNAWEAWNPGSTAFDDVNNPGDFSSDDDNFNFDGSVSDAESASEMVAQMDELADLLDSLGELDGPTGNSSDDNVINAGGNDDLIVLATEAVSTETANTENGNGNTVEFTGQFGWDTIVNFTSDGAIDSEDGTNNNDIMDFTSYLDAAADVRGDSVGVQDVREDEAVEYSFLNQMGADATTSTDIDHNQIRIWEFGDVWGSLDADSDPTPNNFDSLSTADMIEFFENEIAFGDFVVGGDTGASALGSEFLILVGKDGDIEIAQDGTESFEADHADNQFWVFEGVVTSYDTDDSEYAVSFNLLGGVDLAETLITGLGPDDFGVALA